MLQDAQSQGFPAVGFGGDDLDMAPTQGDERKKRKVDFNEDEELSRIIDEANKNLSKEVKERIQNINFYFLLASPAVLSYIGGYKGPQTVDIIIQVQRRQLLEICLPMK